MSTGPTAHHLALARTFATSNSVVLAETSLPTATDGRPQVGTISLLHSTVPLTSRRLTVNSPAASIAT